MKYIIDTNTFIFFLKNKFNTTQAVQNAGVENCTVSPITIAELYFGAYKSNNVKKHTAEIDTLKELFTEAIITSECLEIFGKIKAHLYSIGKPLHDNFDLLIAATALHYNLTLVTDNTNDFKNIPGLKTENWVKRK